MDSSILIAKFIGPFIIVIGTGVLLNTKSFLRIAEDFFKNSATVFITGLCTFMAGLAIVIFHNIWTADWRAIITVFGWLTLIKGASIVILPAKMSKITDILLKHIKFVIIPWTIMFAIGIFLTVKGFKG